MAHVSLLVVAVLLASPALSAAEDEYFSVPVTKIAEALSVAERYGRAFLELVKDGTTPQAHSPAFKHYVNSRATNFSIQADLRARAFIKLCKEFESKEDDIKRLPLKDNDVCRRPSFKCPSITNVYRTHDGTCNNVRRPGCGRSSSGFLRLLPAHYHDGVYEIRRSVTGHALPSAREVQLKVFGEKRISSDDFNQFFMQWGQFVAHDLGLSPTKQTTSGPFQCCESDGSAVLPESKLSDACYPIPVSPHDPVYSKYGVCCMEFVRAMTVVPDDCVLQPAIPMNGATSHLDLSVLYGNNDLANSGLRKNEDGRLAVSVFHEGQFMPLTPDSPRPCASQRPSDTVCFKSADPRTNQQPLRSAIHVLFLREHNRIAKILAKLNPHWKDEQLYQQARRILIAIFQHITYEEMLPILIGKHAFKEHFHAYEYNKKLCPGTFVEFTSVAFRYLHTIAHGILRLMTAGREINKELVLSDFYNRPTIVTKEFDEILIGAVSQECRKDDENFDKEIAHELFRANRTTFGLSLPAIDIQRARDHGVPSYNELRKLCGLPKAHDFDDLSDTMSHTSIKKLRSAYKHVNDIDPLVGGTMEEGMPGAIMGPTFVCLVTKQFLLTQRSDRFFYLNRDQEQPFSPAQLEEIKKASVASLLCTHTGIKKIQRNAFTTISVRNHLVHCHEIPKVDLSAWKDNTSGYVEEAW
ncbi:peroxidase-like [Schistocerca americana]|uniref:peroxidase-like n=1 Tax=Schistocerca americana TaxID=7009 RepID=UPI001F5025C5|nr:peroxidase-like [Schistocerca americana]